MNAPLSALVFHRSFLARSSQHETLWNEVLRFARRAGRLSTYSQTNVQKSRLACMDGLFFSLFSPPAEQDPKGLAEPAERPRRAQPVAGLERGGG